MDRGLLNRKAGLHLHERPHVRGEDAAAVRTTSRIATSSNLVPLLQRLASQYMSRCAMGGRWHISTIYRVRTTGLSAEATTKTLQEQVLPRLERWERQSGAVFEASKTAFIHFTRTTGKDRDNEMPLHFKAQAITPPALVIIMDKKLNFRADVAAAAAKAQGSCPGCAEAERT